MGRNALTSWLVIAGKDFKVLFKNRSLFLVFLGVIVALLTSAIFQGVYLKNDIYDFFNATDFLPALPNYMIYFVIFASSLYMMNQGPVSFINEYQTGTINRLKIQNVSVISLSIGKVFFFFLVALIQVIIFNALATYFFWTVDNATVFMNWSVMSGLIYILLWPLMMVLGAYIIYLLILIFTRTSIRR